jgi:beta-aspartyl-dipeptidase (metallo-type)
MLAGKAGVAHFHVGSGAQGIDLLWEITNKTYIPITNLYPTHMSDRGQALIDQVDERNTLPLPLPPPLPSSSQLTSILG